MRGGEKVVETLCELFPDADIYTHAYRPSRVSDTIRRHAVRTTFISRLPFPTRLYQAYLPLMPLALEQLDLRAYDLVISSEAGPAKGVLIRPDARHICYCHSPMRYLWDMYPEYLAEASVLMRPAIRLLAYYLRRWDVASADRVDHFVANSHNVARRIWRCYRREADVVHPPIDIDRYGPANRRQGDAYLCVGQLVGYKRVDIAIEAFNRMGKQLVIIGDGAMKAELVRRAGPTIRFVGRVDDAALADAYSFARALIFPGEEDFGIVPLEAMACGCPVLAYGRGGALETVLPNRTGFFFDQQTPESLMLAVARFEAAEASLDPLEMAAHARAFSKERFKQGIREVVREVLTTADSGAGSHSPGPVSPQSADPLPPAPVLA